MVIDGQGLAGDGLVLGTSGVGSSGSVIKGLDVIDFKGNGLNIESNSNFVQDDYLGVNVLGTAAPDTIGVAITGSNNTIGGTAAGAGNVIAFNNQDGVDVNSGSGNAIRENQIYNNTGKSIGLASGANDNINRPTGLAYTSVANLTTIDYTITGAAGTYTLDFYASSGRETAGGRVPGQLPGDDPAGVHRLTSFATFPFATTVDQRPDGHGRDERVGRRHVGTGGTSATFTQPFMVKTGGDNVVGSLRQAILDADAAGGNPTITFAAAMQIVPKSPLPVITRKWNRRHEIGFQPSSTMMVQIIGSTRPGGW